MRHFTHSIVLALLVGLYAITQVSTNLQEYRHTRNEIQATDSSLENEANKTMKAQKSKIMLILEDRIENPSVLAKTEDKLRTMSDTEIRLASSLCDRISTKQRTARDEIAFSLVTALIVLS